MIEAVKRLRSQREQSLKLLSPDLHHYLQERLVAASWYPEEDLLALLQVNLKLSDLPMEIECDRMGVLTAREHFKQWYGKRLNTLDARTGLRRLSSLWPALHDTGRSEVVIESPTSGLIITKDFGHPSRELCLIIESYTREFLHLAGFGDVTSEEIACVIKGDEYCAWRYHWTKEI